MTVTHTDHLGRTTELKTNKPFIWCLFSVDCAYDQPQNNLVAWWQEKPTIEALAKFMACPLDKADSDQIVLVAELWKGGEAEGFPHNQSTTYRLELHGEGGV